jgi:hypothetical protein
VVPGDGGPGLAEVGAVSFLGGDPHRAALVDFGLPLAVVFGDLGDLERQLGLPPGVAVGEAEDAEGALLASGGVEGLGFAIAGQADGAVEPRLDPHLCGVCCRGYLKPSMREMRPVAAEPSLVDVADEEVGTALLARLADLSQQLRDRGAGFRGAAPSR